MDAKAKLQSVDNTLRTIETDGEKAIYLARLIEETEDAILCGVPKDQDPIELVELNRELMQRLSTFQDRLRQRIAWHESQKPELPWMMGR